MVEDMPRLTPEQKLERAKQDRDEAIARLRSAAGQVAAKSRKKDTRRKILLGAAVIQLAAQSPKIAEWMERAIKKMPDKDRAAFDGWPLPSPAKDQAASSSATPTRT